jgi:ribosomal protein S18 acetylase RimI-like enzyme
MIVRKANIEDCSSIHELILELALYEKAPNEVITTPDILVNALTNKSNWVFAWVCEDSNKIIGTAVCYLRYSTWKGVTLYLEDLIVTKNYRRNGVGTLLLDEIIGFAKQQKYSRISWQVLDWNTDAIAFYDNYNVTKDDEWVNIHLDLT